MANWVEKARDLINQEKLNDESKIKTAQKKYYDGVIVGFKTLDGLGVEHMLIRIRDEVWESGEIIKIPTQDNLNQSLEKIKTLLGREELPTPQPQYVLVTSSIFYCKPTEDNYDDRRSSSRGFDLYRPKIHSLGIYYFRNSIGIYVTDNDQYTTNAREAEHSGNIIIKNVDEKPQEEIKKWLKRQLIDCTQRKKYVTQVYPENLIGNDSYKFEEKFHK